MEALARHYGAAAEIRAGDRGELEIDSAIDAFVDALRTDCTREFGPWIHRFFHPGQN
ncbi:hypothetical protein [Amycolatopsis methanolica]|uniref:Uncharacterized protein n=1 Tax=Amycolatopsis methanolica 239 TaxID=1068978 RepID=A0A076N217_AMYME|nr:hypothetical protein [Amycolatopsis methanolica]AIJ25156.1 hypothetical protein AMETH_5064 [Amycolatopsis methanolica 239]